MRVIFKNLIRFSSTKKKIKKPMQKCRDSVKSEMPPPDVTFIFAEDVVEWDAYLSRQFEGCILQHEQVEKMTFPLGCTKTPVFSDARVVLLILSPAFVHFLDKHAADCFQFTRLLKPSKTIAMICGASTSAVAGIKNVLVSYDEWRHLEAKDKDINMVRLVVEMMHETLAKSKECERINKPKYKLIPRKIQEGNGKVYVLLSKPLDNNARIRISLEANGAREIIFKKRNPYTLTFIIPDELIHVQNMVNVHIWNGENFMGVSPVKCVSKIGELYGLLNSVVSPYEFLRSTLGVSSLTEVDNQLTTIFKKNLPIDGFHLLKHSNKLDRFITKEEFPTLMHFAARYGLYQLVQELFECPGSHAAAVMKNSKGLIPAQLANNEGHNKVAEAIDNFLKVKHFNEKKDADNPIPSQMFSVPVSNVKRSNPLDDYDIPSQPVPVLHLPINRTVGHHANDRECDYLQMKAAMKENIEPLQNIGVNGTEQDSLVNNSACNAEKVKLSLLESQAKLIEIMEAYKKGASLTEVEKMHNEWKTHYQVSDLEANSTLDGLRNLYAKAQKAKSLRKHSSSFSELRQFLNSKWRRKDSTESKGSMSRRNSKDSTCSEKISGESNRPVSTLSVLSNTSSSSSSSFDRMSTTSAGSDSGHHSDFGDDRNNKLRVRYESRYQQQQNTDINNVVNLQKEVSHNSKPPAPPPRPIKTPHYGSLENCKHIEASSFSKTKKLIAPSFEEALKILDYVPPSSKSSSLNNDFKTGKKTLLSNIEFHSFEDQNENYDRPPPPRPSNAMNKDKSQAFKSSVPTIIAPKADYDVVPPPLPVSAPPLKERRSSFDIEQSYDIPPSFSKRSNSISSEYDFPKASLLDNTDSQPVCTCHMNVRKNNMGSVKSCCMGNKLSSLKQIVILPGVPSLDVVDLEKLKNSSVKMTRPLQHHQYSNVCLNVPKINGDRDSIPDEIAPPPPIFENESPEEHYKMVGAPTPVPATFKIM